MTFERREDQLYCEEVSLQAIAEAVGTPTYVYSQAELTGRARQYLEAAGGPENRICYATKANANLALLRLLAGLGLGADVTSGGELYLALEAGFPPAKIIFSGVGKTDEEIHLALEAEIAALHVESEEELAVIAGIAAGRGRSARIGVRLNPNIRAETHPYISTGLHEHKFGVEPARGIAMLRAAAASPHLEPVGIAAHIGSQIRELAPFAEAAALLADIGSELRAGGLPLAYIDVGGGWGIDYSRLPGEAAAGEITAWVAAVRGPIESAGFRLAAEPGRSIVGPAGLLLTRTVFTKERSGRRFVITDAGMNDLLRPTLYQARHPIEPVVKTKADGGEQVVDVVGPICESGDFLAKDRPLPPLNRGDLLAVLHAGAYGFAMSSNYNGRPRAAEVLVDGTGWTIIRRRQQFADLRSE